MIAARSTALLLSLCGPPAVAQFVNRATWLGLDEEGVRRDFSIGTEYFLDRFSYVVTPPWWDPDLRRFHDRLDYRVGSTSSTQFTIEGALDHGIELGDGFTFRYHFLQAENRDTRFVRNEIALEYGLGNGGQAVFVQAQPFAEKAGIDIGVGAFVLRDGDDALRVMLTGVDWTNEKSNEFEYERDPLAAHVAGVFGGPDSLRVAFELGAQLPLEVRELSSGARLSLQRYIGSLEGRLRLSGHDVLVSSIEGERTDKEFLPLAAGDPLREDFDRTFHQLRLEWWRDAPTPWSVGVLHTFLKEHGQRPNDPANDLVVRRREWLGIVRVQLRASAKLSFEPQLFAGNVRNRFLDADDTRDNDRFEGKIAWNARWDFSPNVTLALIVSTQLDEFAFGGGGAQFVARF